MSPAFLAVIPVSTAELAADVAVPAGELVAFGLAMEEAQKAVAAALGLAEAERERAGKAEAELAALADSTGALLRSAGEDCRKRAEGAEEKIREAREQAARWAALVPEGDWGIAAAAERRGARSCGRTLLNLLADGTEGDAERFNGGKPVRWSPACAPGGMVCAVPDRLRPDGICGNPVESEPCGEHPEVAHG